jgi:SAM-dependent methyltransferase
MPPFIRDIYRGKTIGRILFNDKASGAVATLKGRVLDIAGTVAAAYSRNASKETQFVSANLKEGGDVHIDFDRRLPFEDNEFDHVLLFNALYIANDPGFTLMEAKRVLKKNGSLFLSVPFVMNEAPEPHDYRRFTSEGTRELLLKAGYRDIEIDSIGERFSAAATILWPFFFFNTIRIGVFIVARVLDGIVPHSLRKRHPMPIIYFCTAKK